MQSQAQFNTNTYILTIERDIKSGVVRRISQLSKRCIDLHFTKYLRLHAMMVEAVAKRAE